MPHDSLNCPTCKGGRRDSMSDGEFADFLGACRGELQVKQTGIAECLERRPDGVGWVIKGVGTGVPGMADWAVWMEELLESVAMRVGLDIVGNIRSYPLNIRELRVVKTRSGALVTGGYFIGSGGIKNCSPKKYDCRHFIQPWKSIHYCC